MNMLKFIQTIDFATLKLQKADLLMLIDKEEEGVKESLTGILHLIDSIQDIAVDQYGYNENDVFTLTNE